MTRMEKRRIQMAERKEQKKARLKARAGLRRKQSIEGLSRTRRITADNAKSEYMKIFGRNRCTPGGGQGLSEGITKGSSWSSNPVIKGRGVSKSEKDQAQGSGNITVWDFLVCFSKIIKARGKRGINQSDLP